MAATARHQARPEGRENTSCRSAPTAPRRWVSREVSRASPGAASSVLWAQGPAWADLPSKRRAETPPGPEHPPLPALCGGSLPRLGLACPRRLQVGTAGPLGVPGRRAWRGGLHDGPRARAGVRGRGRSQGGDSCAEGRPPSPFPVPPPGRSAFQVLQAPVGPWARLRSPRGDSAARLRTEDQHLCVAWASPGPASPQDVLGPKCDSGKDVSQKLPPRGRLLCVAPTAPLERLSS